MTRDSPAWIFPFILFEETLELCTLRNPSTSFHSYVTNFKILVLASITPPHATQWKKNYKENLP